MRIGANWPYDSRARDETWRLLAALEPTEITISSHEPDADYERLLDLWPGDFLLWHVRMKGNRAWWPKDVYTVEWGNERSPVDRCAWLIQQKAVPYVILGNEPDIELAAEPVDNDGNMTHAAVTYLAWSGRAIKELRTLFGSQVKLALAPLSQGAPGRFAYWWGRYNASGLLTGCDFIAEHAYTNGGPPDDPNWGGRPLALATLGLPVHVTETNDNGVYANQDRHERAADFAGYADFLRDSRVVESLSIFTLPGGAQDANRPSWWFIGPEIVEAVHDALIDQPASPPADVPPILPTPEAPPVANLDTLRAARWGALDPKIPYNPDTGIATYWSAHPELGSALTPEIGLDDGTVGQAFVNGIVLWDAEHGARAA